MMADSIEFNIANLDPVLAKMARLSKAINVKSSRAALRVAGAIIVKAAKLNASGLDDPDTGRKISSNVGMRWNGRRFKATGDIAFRIGILKGARIPKDNHASQGAGTATPHWRLLEFGTKSFAAKPFLRPAMENNVMLVTETFVEQLDALLTGAIR